MTTKLTRNEVMLYLGVIALVLAIMFEFGHSTPEAKASSYPGSTATVATSSTLAVGPQLNMFAFGTTSPANESRYSCAARIITTVGQPIMISFASVSSTTLSQVVGHLQPASTTVAYDGGVYGCGYMTIRGLTASTTISMTETR